MYISKAGYNIIMNRICKICGKEFDTYPSYIKRGGGIYCSRECQDKGHSLYLKTLPKEKHPRWKGGLIKTNCLTCGKEIMKKRCRSNKPNFCSMSCANSYNTKLREKKGQILRCKICGEDFYRIPSAINRETKKPRYCSQKCRAIDNIKNQSKEGTDIERITEEWLKTNKIEFEKQREVEGVALVDFFVYPNKCLFCDGNFWHSAPERIMIDNRQRSELKSRGYEVYSLLGSVILKGGRFYEILQN